MSIRFKRYQPTPILSGHLRMGGKNPHGEEIAVNSRYIARNGRPVIPVMGEYHFCRDKRENWAEELAKIKAGGVDIVATYMLWIYHEEIEGEFDFSGDLDIRAFIESCAEQGLEVMLRIGPWAHGECRNGGFPDWLQKSGIPLRSNDPRYMIKACIWYEKVFQQVKGLFFKDGGPIVGIQFENELVDDAEHLLALKNMALKIGYDAPLYTATGWNSKYGAKIPEDEMLPVFSGYVDAPWDESLEKLPPSPHFSFDPTRNETAMGKELMPDTDESGWRLPYERYPFATCELGGGLQVTHHRRPIVSAMDVYALSLVKLGCGNNLIGYYMYHGGTNKIGKLSTFQESRASGYPNDVPILNYDFQTCLSQYGEAREQYGMLNMLHLFAHDFGHLLAPMEHVPAEVFIPCTDTEHLRCCLRTDGQAGFVFVNHYQRGMKLKDVLGARIEALGVSFPPMDVKGDVCFFMPVNMPLDDVTLRFATAQPLCRTGNTLFFSEIPGVKPQYEFVLADGSVKSFVAEPGFESAFDVSGLRIITLTFNQARYTRRLDGEIHIGIQANLYRYRGYTLSTEYRDFHYRVYFEDTFLRCSCTLEDREWPQYTLDPLDTPPLDSPHLCELDLGGPGKRTWYRLTVDGDEGYIILHYRCDAAQIYADGQLVADLFYYGRGWSIPAKLLYKKECYLVMTEPKSGVYLER